jgi:hypothetical protein
MSSTCLLLTLHPDPRTPKPQTPVQIWRHALPPAPPRRCSQRLGVRKITQEEACHCDLRPGTIALFV